MSAWSVGAGTGLPPAITPATVGDEAVANTPTAADAPTVDKLLAWIPGEVVSTYMALVLALQSADTENGPADKRMVAHRRDRA